MSGKWLTAADAYRMVFPGKKFMGGPNAIIRHAADDMVRAECSRLVRSGPRGESERPRCVLPKIFWRGRSMITDWQTGAFSACVQQDGQEEEWRAFGVTFEPTGIESIAQAAGSPTTPIPVPSLSNPTGKRATKYDWEGALIGVIAAANSLDGLPSGYGANAAIVELLARWFRDNQDQEPATSELKKRASRILNEIDLSKIGAGKADI